MHQPRTYTFRQAQIADVPVIWQIIQQAIGRRKAEGSEQWQNGYPNLAIIKEDVAKAAGYVLREGDTMVGYAAILINDEPEYSNIEGKWLSDNDFVVFHRLAVAESHVGKGLSKKMFEYIEQFARENNICSIKADTSFDNAPMLHTFTKQGYTYCGEVYFRGSARKAYEKVLIQR